MIFYISYMKYLLTIMFVGLLFGGNLFSQNKVPIDSLWFIMDEGVHYYKGKPFDGIGFYKYTNDLLLEKSYKDGKLVSEKVWWSEGKLKIESSYKDEKKHGLYREWYENGQLMKEENYKFGKEDGLNRKWHENGQIRCIIKVKVGVVISERYWYENGQLLAERNRIDGKIDGLYRGWYENGQLKFEENYKDGIYGLYSGCYENGQLSLEINKKEGKYDGLYRHWHENGQLKWEWNWKNDDRISVKCWDENGNETECED